MKAGRIALLAVAFAAAVVFLLDWTVGALDVMRIGRLRDLEVTRASMQRLDSGALVFEPGVDLLLGDGSFRVCTDDDGRRCGRAAAQARDGDRRIALLGDAATFGWGVEDSLSFARGLESRLIDSGAPSRVDNYGLVFGGPAELLQVFDQRVLPAGPDLVLVCGPASTFRMTPRWRAYVEGEPRPRSWSVLLPSIARVCDRIDDGAIQLEEGAMDAARWTSVLESMRRSADAAGVELLAVDLGVPEFDALCKEVGVSCLQVGPTEEERRAGLSMDATGRLPDVAGHSLLARNLAAALEQRQRR